MKRIIIAAVLLIYGAAYAENGEGNKDKSRTFTVERTIQAPVEKVWKVVGEEFADIAKSHPVLASSHYVEGTPLSGEGCTRVCNMDEAGKKYTKEKMVDYNPDEYKFKVQIEEAGGIPMVPSKSYMIYDVDPVNSEQCKITLKMVFLTDPAFLGAIAKGKFKKTISDYALAIEHHVLTGEDVNPDTFKSIKKQYQ